MRQDTRQAQDTRQVQEAGQVDYQAVAEQAGQAAAQGIAPGSPEGKAVLDRIVAPGTPAVQRTRLLEQLETFTDARWKGTGSYWPSSTASRWRRPWCPASNG